MKKSLNKQIFVFLLLAIFTLTTSIFAWVNISIINQTKGLQGSTPDGIGEIIDFSPGPRIDYEGIDYAGTKDANVKFFRVDGKVSDIVLESYHPRFSLPAGAKIERYIGGPYEEETPGKLADPNNWDEMDLNDDYAAEGDFIIHYRVTSEDGLEQVHYYVTAFDIKYNLTLRFRVMYEQNGVLIDAHQSPINNKYLLIESKNLELDDTYHTTSNDVSGFPTLTPSMIVGLKNQSTLFQFITNNPNQLYRFGRNMTGAYNFNIITPKYQGVEVPGVVTPGQRYHYDMYMVPPGFFVDDQSEWYQNKYKLPSMNIEGHVGRYYYIVAPAGNPITREIVIVIRPSTQNHWWGIYDDYTSFD